MKIKYTKEEFKSICESFKEAKIFFGGNEILAKSLLSRINAIANASVILDIIVFPPMHFHNLYDKGKNKNLKWYYAIDVKTRKDKWRIILRPLNEDETVCEKNIDEVAKLIKMIEIKEVSDHYE